MGRQTHGGTRAMAGALLALLTACSEIELLPVTPRLEVNGLYCAATSTTFGVPIRILLIVDTSKSMEINDPRDGRAKAASNLITSFSPEQDVEFGIISFDDYGVPLTDGFTRDPAMLGAALTGLTRRDGFTNYLDALSRAEMMINDDLAEVADEIATLSAAGEPIEYKKPWYFVVFLSDGLPRLQGGEVQSDTQILFLVNEIVNIPEPAMGATLHTAFVGAADDEQRPQAEALLRMMAEAGHGSYFSFENGDTIDFRLFNFQIRRRYDLKQFVVYNRLAINEAGVLHADSDDDGLSDLREEELGLSPLVSDSDGDGFGDGFEVIAGLNPKLKDLYCDRDPTLDSDSDGLSDCEEDFLDFDETRFDTDGDMFADRLELFSGTNPKDSADILEDLDFDGVVSGEEIRSGTNPGVDERELNPKLAAAYRLTHVSVTGENGEFIENCYEFSVSNLPLVRPQADGVRPEGVNEIVVEVIESPEDSPEEVFELRRLVVAVEARQNSRLDLTDYAHDFVTISRQEVIE